MIYIAAPLDECHVAKLIARTLRQACYRVISTWHVEVKHGDKDPPSPEVRRQILATNIDQIDRSRLVVAWTGAGVPRGTYGEIAWALATGKRVIWIQGRDGAGAMIFDAHHNVTILRDVSEQALLDAVNWELMRIQFAEIAKHQERAA